MADISINRINWVDVLALILFVRMGYVGFKSGVGPELLRLAGLVGGIFVSFRYYQHLGDALAARIFLRTEWAAAGVMVFIVVVLYLSLTRGLRLLERIVQVTFESRISHLGGLLLGLLRGGLIVSVILVVCRQLPSDYLDASIERHSLSGRRVSRMAPAVYDTVSGLPRRLLARLQ